MSTYPKGYIHPGVSYHTSEMPALRPAPGATLEQIKARYCTATGFAPADVSMHDSYYTRQYRALINIADYIDGSFLGRVNISDAAEIQDCFGIEQLQNRELFNANHPR